MPAQIYNFTRKKISPARVKNIVRKSVSMSGGLFRKTDISVVLVNKKRISELNRVYRKKKGPTDILSFNYGIGYNKKKDIEGELVVCPGFVAESAKKNRINFEDELTFVVAHGVLHLLGMKHGKRMYDLQDKIVRQLKKK
jgi:probable rRNA maturation factor